MSAALAIAPKPTKAKPSRRPRTTGNINLRADAATRSLIDRAASVCGQNRTEFMLQSARMHAQHVLLSKVYFEIDDAAWDALNADLADPPPANEALRAAFRATPAWDRP